MCFSVSNSFVSFGVELLGEKKKCKYLWSGKECRSGEVRGSDVCAPVFSYTESLRGPRERVSQLSAGGEPRRVPRRPPRRTRGGLRMCTAPGRPQKDHPAARPTWVSSTPGRGQGTGGGRGRLGDQWLVMSLERRLRVRARLSSLVACGSAV